MLVILDRQHGDKGARFDPGVLRAGLREVDLTTAYLAACREHLTAAGVSVLYLDSGRYSDRHAQANAAAAAHLGPVVYVAAHVNAGGGDYAAVFHDARSHRGALIALCLEQTLYPALLEVSAVKPIGAARSGWTANAWHTIRGIYDGPSNISGVCLEPGFIDHDDHAELWTPAGLERIGRAVAEGLLAYGTALESL